MKRICKILFLALCLALVSQGELRAAGFQVYATLTFTNVSGPVQSNTVTINTNVVMWRTNATNSAFTVLLTNTPGGNCTNLKSDLINFRVPGVTVVGITNGTNLVLMGTVNTNLAVSFVGTYAWVSYKTNPVYSAETAAFPFTLESYASRSNYINGMVSSIVAYALSEKFPAGTPALSKYIDESTSQSMTGKTIRVYILSTGEIASATMSATNSFIDLYEETGFPLTKPLSRGLRFWRSDGGGLWTHLGPIHSDIFNGWPGLYDSTATNAMNISLVDPDPSQWFVSPALLNLKTAFQLFPNMVYGGKSNLWYVNNYFIGTTNFTFAEWVTNFFAVQGQMSALTVTNLTNAGTIRGGNISGAAVSDGTLSNMTTIGGTLKATKSSGSFDVSSDLAYTVTNFTSLANGNNIALDFGSNVFVRLAGSLTGDGAICGIVNGRGGKTHILYNDQPYTVFLAQDTSDPVATNRFWHKWVSGNLSIPPYGWGGITYEMAAQRWQVSWIYPQSGVASNAVALLNGLATNLFVWPSASNVVPLIVYTMTNHMTNALEFQNNTGKVMTAFGPSGGLHIGGGSAAGASNLLVDGASTLTGGATVAGGVNATGVTNQSLTASRLMASGANKEETSVTLTNGQILIGNGGGYTAGSLTPGYGLSSTQRAGALDMAVQRSFFGTHMARRRWWSYVPGSTTAYVALGAPTAPVVSETVSVISDANTGQAMTHTNLNTAFDSSLMRESAMYARTGRNLYFSTRVTIYNTNQNTLINFGWCNSTSRVTTNSPTGVNGTWVRASSTAPDTNFKLICNNNSGAQTEVDTGIAIAGSPSSHLFEAQMNDSGGASNVVLYIDGALVATATSDLPSTGINMLWFADFKTLDAVAKSNRIEHIYLEADR